MPTSPSPRGPGLRPANPSTADSLLATKVNAPAATPAQVVRTRVAELLCQASTARLVLVRAPAGFGKTTAMVQAQGRLQASGVDTAWLTLDRADNDASRFLACLAMTVARMSGEAAPGASLDVVERLAAHATPFALFFDDFELIQEPAVLGLVHEIVDHLPRCGQVVIGSRSLPDLGLGRLRARGQLVEVDTDDLRFSVDETIEFFRLRPADPVPAEALVRLHRKTEGWVAAIWLASLALSRRGAGSDFIDRFSGSHQAVADYLAEDVLVHQPAEVRDFLLRTSILRHLNASVCQALNPRRDCDRILRELAAANLFVTPIAGEAAWRYHSLFADFLRAQLAREQPEEHTRLHLAASGWYEAQGRPVPAIDHAIEGGDHPHALVLLARHVRQFLEQGRMRLLARWFAAIPEAALRAQPLLEVASVWASCFTRGPWEAMARLEASGSEGGIDRAETQPSTDPAETSPGTDPVETSAGTDPAETSPSTDLAETSSSTDPAVRAHVNALRPLLLAMMDRHADAYAVGRERLAQLPTCEPFADTVLANAMADIVSTMGEHVEAHRLLDVARRGRLDSAFNRMYSDSVEGVLDLQQGRLRQATARFRMAVDATRPVSYAHTNGNAWAGVLYAGAMYEANRLGETEHLLNVYLPLARDVGLPDHMISSHWMLARIAFQRGDIDQAFQLLLELEYLGHHRQLPRVVASARLERARLLLLQGNEAASRDELTRADDPAVWARVAGSRLPAHDTDTLAIGLWRHALTFGDAAGAVPCLRAALDASERASLHRRALKLRVLLALALWRSGEPASAVDAMAQALRFAAQEGFVRLILDEGPAVAPLVHRVAAGLQASQTPRADPIYTESLQRLEDVLGPPAASEPLPAPSSGRSTLLEPLTRKEIRVLQLLAEGYSNSAMAEKLFVSDSTVRTHLRNINTKLDAQSRTQAVAIARRLGVIR